MQETAINIGLSCRLLSSEMPKIIINTTTLNETREGPVNLFDEGFLWPHLFKARGFVKLFQRETIL